jgi:hypothetical protein
MILYSVNEWTPELRAEAIAIFEEWLEVHA